MDNNDLRLFTCNNCLTKNMQIKFLANHKRCGFLCPNCWDTYFIRLNQVIGKTLSINGNAFS